MGTPYGQFVYAQKRVPSSTPANNLARLISIQNQTTGTKCLGFFYNMYGSTKNKLQVVVNTTGAYPVWMRQVDNGNKVE